MQDIVNVAVNNGLGIASFIALLYFIMNINKQNNQNQKDLNETLKAVNSSMLEIQIAMVKLTERIQEVENKIEKEK